MSKSLEYESFILFIICFIVTITNIYAISNMTNLRHLNKNIDLKLLEHKSLYNQNKMKMEKQNQEYYKLIKVLREKHVKLIKDINSKKHKPKLKENDEYFDKTIESILTNNDNCFENNNLYIDDRWSYI